MYIDYLGLASWDDMAYINAMQTITRSFMGEWKPANWLQYKGKKQGAIFIGRGRQNGKDHTVIRVSGHIAGDVARLAKETLASHWYATRIDLQVTVNCPEGYSARHLFYNQLGDIKNRTLIDGPEGDTIYLGSRRSAIYTRLYEKMLETKYLRLEFELKSMRAAAAWDNWVWDKITMGQLYQYYLDKCQLPDGIKWGFRQADDYDRAVAMVAEIDHNKSKVLTWLADIMPAIVRHMNDHDIGPYVRIMVDELYKSRQEVDETD